MAYGYVNNIFYTIGNVIFDDTIVSVIGNIHFEVLLTDRKIILVGFDYDLYKNFFPIGASKVDTNLLNGTVIAYLNEYMLLQGYYIYLLFIYQAHNFGIDIYEASSKHSGKQYTHVGDWLISMNYISVNDASKGRVL